jgi:hypothetical protein
MKADGGLEGGGVTRPVGRADQREETSQRKTV